jgi:GT2 family glycosyltransferase
MSEDVLISVVVPTYNRPAYLRQTLESIGAQTWRNFETLVISDGPSAVTEQIIENLRDHRFRFLAIEHSGRPAPVRNAGLAQAKGELITLCDDDDLWEPDKLAAQIEALRGSKAALCFTGLLNIDPRSQVTGRRKAPPHFYDRWPRWGFLSLPGYYIAPSSVMLPRKVLDAVGPFDERPLLRGREDVELFVRIAFRTRKRFARVERPLVRYRSDPSSPGIGLQAGNSHIAAFLEAVKENAGMSDRIFRRFAAVQWLLHARAMKNIADTARILELLDLADAQQFTFESRLLRLLLRRRHFANEPGHDAPH